MINPLNSFDAKEKKAFYLVILLFITFLVFRILSGNFYLSDSQGYLNIAEKLNTLSFLDASTEYRLDTLRPIIYPLFLAIFYNFPVLVSYLME